ncbi:hypothetical protein [Sulfitobacter marinus]|uniref:hypothetical protein n=1 Tax=Sulfitobacter marinus TaxID=394264 RepID=UPI001587A765|nr:hypothetical protein [Sulfitobacter marinus]
MNDITYTSKELLTWLWHDYLKKHIWMLGFAIGFMATEGEALGANFTDGQRQIRRAVSPWWHLC